MADYSLQDLERDFYLGSYQTCINKANSLPDSAESIYYLCLSYKAMNRKENLEKLLMKAKTEMDDTFIEVFLSDDQGFKKSLGEDDERSRLLMSGIHASQRNLVEALRVIDHFNTLRTSYAKITIYNMMSRFDLAVKQLVKMQELDEQNPITELAEANLLLAKGRPDQSWRLAQSLSERYRPTPLLNNLQTAAAICLGEFDSAKTLCEGSLDMDSENVEALINMIHILSKLRPPKSETESSKVRSTKLALIERNLDRLRNLQPDHDYLKALDSIHVDMAS